MVALAHAGRDRVAGFAAALAHVHAAVKVHRRDPDLREGEVIRHPRAWLLKTVRNQLGKHWRRQKQGEQLAPNADFDLLAGAVEQDAALESEPLHLPEYFSLLSRREEEALVLRVEGLRYRQIAEQMGVTTNSVGTLILRAVRKIRTAREKRACRGRAVQV